MSLAKLFFRKGNFISDIEVDVVITEGATAIARVTKNPVQSGADFNDHKIIDPMTFTMEGVVSNASANIIKQAQITAQAFSGIKRNEEAWEDLLELHANKNPFELVQGLRSYNNVTMLTLSENQDKSTSNALFFTATFQEINIVGGSLTSDIFSDPNVADKATPTISGGLKQLN